MKITILSYSRGKIKVRNRIENHPTMTVEKLKSSYRGHVVSPEEVAKLKIELPGPEYKVLKTDRYYVAFTEE